MGDCIFCAIADGDIPAAKIYEDDKSVAFLDINPLSTGHTLVIPKAHAAKVEDADPVDAAAVMQTAQRITPALCDASGCPDATLAINNGPDAGQEVPHLHLHIIPRTRGDSGGPIHALFPERPTPDADAIEALATKVREALEAEAV